MLITTRRDARSGALVWPAALIVWGPGAASSPHRHHCIQLILALTGHLRVRQRPRTDWRRCGAVLIPPDAQHEIDAHGLAVLIGFMDPESDLAAAFGERLGSAIVEISDRVVAGWRRSLGDPATLEPARVDTWLRSALLHETSPRRIHPRVRRVLRHLRQEPLSPGTTSLARLARIAALSPSRFMHVFTESIGIPLRPYLLWLRVQRAAGALATGRTVTEAAHLAGFADAPHLTRTFRRMLGTTPRELIRRAPSTRELRLEPHQNSRFVQDTRDDRSLR